MNGLPRDFRETLIRLDHDAKTAEIWTEDRGVTGRALRRGWTVRKRSARGVWMVGPISAILIRKAPSRPGFRRNAGQFRRRPGPAVGVAS
jgi:hypothetical protein